jgi:predicted phage replisome organizer
MSDVKWIKISVDIFDDEKFDAINGLADKNDIQLVWVKLLCLAGRCNENGFLMITQELPYTDEMLAGRFRMDIGVVQRALTIFQELRMIEVVDNIYMVSNWTKYQSVGSLEKIREQGRLRQQRFREKQTETIRKNKCVYCGEQATGYDHVIPLSRGGSDTDDNKVFCCRRCNEKKNCYPLTDFLNYNPDLIDKDSVINNPVLKKHVEYVDGKWRNVTNPLQSNVNCSYSLSNNKHNFNTSNNLNNYRYLIDNNIYKESIYIKDRPELDAIISDWMTYKDGMTPKSKNKYASQMSMSKVLTVIIKHDKEYGTDAVREVVDLSISNQWVGILWDKIEKQGYRKPMSEPTREVPTGLEKPKKIRQ